MFKDRQDAGQQLAVLLQKYKGQPVVVFALPRGGVVPALEIAKALEAPLDLIIAHKIGHPQQPEYAVAAVSESGLLYISDEVNPEWLEKEKERQIKELKKKRALFLPGRKQEAVEGKIAILVDDGIATGATMKVGIKELQARHPKKLVVAVPVAPASTAQEIAGQVDEFIALKVLGDADFMGAVGAHYDEFEPVENDEVIKCLAY